MHETFEGGQEAAFYTNYKHLLSDANLINISRPDAVYHDTLIAKNLDKLIQNNGEKFPTSMQLPVKANDSNLVRTGSSVRIE